MGKIAWLNENWNLFKNKTNGFLNLTLVFKFLRCHLQILQFHVLAIIRKHTNNIKILLILSYSI